MSDVLWVLVEGRLHQATAGPTALCGKPTVGCEVLTTRAALDHVKTWHTTVCGSCERRRADLEGRSDPVMPMALSASQRETLAAMKAQREQQRRTQAATQADASTRGGASVRAVSGGLPTLGKKRR